MTASGPKRLTVVILIDALGWEIVQRFEFCRRLLPRSAALETVLGYSSAAIPSLLSGKTPVEHGVWAMYKYDPKSSPFRFLRGLPRLPHALEWRLRVLVKRITDRRRMIDGYYDLYDVPLNILGYFDLPQRKDPYQPGALDVETIFDRVEAAGVPYKVWTYRTAESSNFDELVQSIGGDQRLLFLYTAELDALMHRVGVFHNDVKNKLNSYEQQVHRIVETANEQGQEIDVYLFSDHGMTDVRGGVDLMGEVERWGFERRRRFRAFYDSTMARFWCAADLRAELVERLNGTGWGRVLGDDELEVAGCRFEDGSYGDIVFLLSPGRLIVPSYMGRETIAAMHGYDPDDRFSKGVFMTNDAAVELPASILDLSEFLADKVINA